MPQVKGLLALAICVKIDQAVWANTEDKMVLKKSSSISVGFRIQPSSREMNVMTVLQLFGMSARMGGKLHAYAKEGFGGHLEEFVPTLAKESGFKVVSIPIPLFIGDR